LFRLVFFVTGQCNTLFIIDPGERLAPARTGLDLDHHHRYMMDIGDPTLIDGIAADKPHPRPSPSGVWHENVFYSYALANGWLASAAARAEAQARARDTVSLASSLLAACPDGATA
jgi:hypothetical protein